MKPLSFEEWHKNKYQYEPQKDLYLYDMIDDVHEYAQYRAKLAWDEAAEVHMTCQFCGGDAIKVEYKETL